MTITAETRSLTANLEIKRAGETWPRVPAAEVSATSFPAAKPTLDTGSKEERDLSELKPSPRRPILFPEDQPPEPREVFLVLQDWEGSVETIGSETFTARLRDRADDGTYVGEMAELPIADVSEDDQELLQPGAVFYLTVGRLVRESGRRDLVGRIVFRRLPAWTASSFRRAEQRADRLARFLAPQD